MHSFHYLYLYFEHHQSISSKHFLTLGELQVIFKLYALIQNTKSPVFLNRSSISDNTTICYNVVDTFTCCKLTTMTELNASAR